MDDIVYERDYRRKPEEYSEDERRSIDIFNQAFQGSFVKDYVAAIDAIPKIIIMKDKENYEYLLARCDDFAKQNHGTVRGMVDYHKWCSTIDLHLSYMEFDDSDSLNLLKEIAERSNYANFIAADDGGIKLHIMINYFDELMTEDYRAFLEYDAIMNDEKLADMLGISSLSPELEAGIARLNAIFDRFEQKTTYNRTTVFQSLFAHMAKESEENQTIDRMIELAEMLLDKILLEQDNSQD